MGLDEDDFVFHGTPIEREDEIASRKKKAVAGASGTLKTLPAWKQEVTDEEGRRRFHGAFTGGYSAGYYNTVGSKEDGKSNFAKELYGESLELSKPETSLGLSNLENEGGSFYGSSDEEPSEAYSMNKDTENMREKFHMLGYRDGISAGQEAAAQEGYNVGYKESVLAGYKFGIVRGVSSALAFLPDDLREKLIDEQETRDKFRNLHGSVHDLSTEAALKLFYGALTTKQGEEKSGEKEPCSSLCSGSGCVSGSRSVSATNDLGSYVTELSSLLDNSPKIKVRLEDT